MTYFILFISIVSWSFQPFCDRLAVDIPGAELQDERFSIPSFQISQVLHERDILEQEEHLVISGPSAKILFVKLLNYYSDNDPEGCHLPRTPRVIYALAPGAGCVMKNREFRCESSKKSDGQLRSILPAVGLPRPRLGAGNAQSILDECEICQ